MKKSILLSLFVLLIVVYGCTKVPLHDDTSDNNTQDSNVTVYCGNGLCDNNENRRTCPIDCDIVKVNTSKPPETDISKKIPLIDMEQGQYYYDEDGGLYGDYENTPPEKHRQAALNEIAKIEPLDSEGNPSPNGKIVFLSLGMSNAKYEFNYFIDTIKDKNNLNDKMTVVNGAISGQAVVEWATNKNNFYDQLYLVKKAGVTPEQVQVMWAKFAVKNPTGDFIEDKQIMVDNMKSVMQLAKQQYPNLKVVYISSRIYAGYAKMNLSPEPYTYWDGFAVRQLILDQINGDVELNYDSANGEVKAPLLLWGPYLWADGLNPRSDGLIWEKNDFRTSDGTHPSDPKGSQKVADILYNFFSTNELTKSWFLN